MGFDENLMTTAIGLAANQSAGLREAHASNGSQFIQGHTARCGFMAALLAARGFTCNDTMIEGDKGFGVSFGTRPQFEAALDKLGNRGKSPRSPTSPIRRASSFIPSPTPASTSRRTNSTTPPASSASNSR